LNNKGFEITINSTNISSANFRWTSSFNFSRNTNKVTNLGGQVLGSDVNKAIEGQPLGVFYAREFAGADPENGDALYYRNTIKADGTKDRSTTNDYNEAADVVIGNPSPDFIYGLDNAVTYKDFDFDALLQGVYGNQIYNGGGHNAIDIAAPIGTPVHAALTGIILATGNTDLNPGCYSFGKWIMVRHANGLSTLYAHLSAIYVSAGQAVATGEVMGLSGMTGYATGPHIHFGVYATEGTRISTLGAFRGGKGGACSNAVMPVATKDAYLNPLSYL